MSDDLMPDGAGDFIPGQTPDGGLRLNFSSEEVSSEARSFAPLPRGEYKVRIAEIELKQSNSKKHAGKPYWNLLLEVIDGPFAKRKLFTNVMLFEGALYTMAQMMKAVGLDPDAGYVPGADYWIGQEMVAVVAQKQAMEKDGEKEDGSPNYVKKFEVNAAGVKVPVMDNDVKGFKPVSAGVTPTAASSNSSSSLLPG